MKKYKTILLLIIFFLCCQLKVSAQQTIITVPSSEIMPLGGVLLKESNRFKPFRSDPFVSMTPTITIGSGFNTEISGGVSTSIASDTVVRGDFSAKKVCFLGKYSRFTIGTRINPYLAETTAPDNFTYSHLSTRIRKTKTTLTAGMYIAGNKDVLPDKPGVVLGLEQVIIANKLRFAMDWISRNESYGTLGAGLKYRPIPTVSITNAVLIPNGNKGKLAFLVSFSKYTSIKKQNYSSKEFKSRRL